MDVLDANKYLNKEGLAKVWDLIKQYVRDKSSIVEVTYAELKSLRDNSQLIPGQQYRITDYETSTSQAGTTSANHPFDIIVTALDESTLSENASAIKSARDTDNYFGTENLEAWQLKYCLDNDTDRFAWAVSIDNLHKAEFVAMFWNDPVNGINYNSHIRNDKIYDWGIEYDPETEMDNIVIYKSDADIYSSEGSADYFDQYFYRGIVEVDGGEYDSWKKFETGDGDWVTNDDGQYQYALTERMVFDGQVIWPESNTGETDNRKGVIYNMIDEYGNECPYDFKNIKFYYEGLGTDVYTFTWIDDSYNVIDTSVFGNNGTLTYYGEIRGVYGNVIKPYNKFYSNYKIKQSLNNITFISDYARESEGNNGFEGCINNSFGNDCHGNSFGNDCHGNSFGDNCTSNSFGNTCYNNSFGNICYNNSFGNLCYYNSFGNYCYGNSFGNNCYGNSFGNNCYINSFGNLCKNNSFGNDCYSNSFDYGCYWNSFGNYCCYNSFGNYCYGNSFGNYCYGNSFRKSASQYDTLLNYCQYNHFDDGCSYNTIWTSNTTGNSKQLKNINVNRGVSGTSRAQNYINVDTINSDKEINVINYNSHIYVDYGDIFKVTYSELVDLRDNSQLIPGRQYRITDYNTTTSQRNTRSAEHKFDIIVTAIDEYRLSEEAQAIQNSEEGYFDDSNLSAWKIWYSLDNDIDRFAWAGDERIETDIVDVVDTSNCTISVGYSYDDEEGLNKFDNRVSFISQVWADPANDAYLKGSAIGELISHWGYETDPNGVENCLTLYGLNLEFDDETDEIISEEGITDDRWYYRGIVTVDSADYDYWEKAEYGGYNGEFCYMDQSQLSSEKLFFLTDRIVSGTPIITTTTVERVIPLEPKGVIYRMIDEFGNDCPYDFKNIQFERKLTNGVLDTENGVDTYCYTFNAYCSESSDIYDASVIAHRNVIEDDTNRCYRNVIKEYYKKYDHVKYLTLNNIVFLNTYAIYHLFHCYSNSFGNDCCSNTFGNDCFNNTFGNDCYSNSFGNLCYYNSFGNYCYGNSFGNNCYSNSFGNDCYSNSFGNNCYSNSFGNYCYGNSFGNYCYGNSFGNNCYSNSFGDSCNYNSFENKCSNNIFGNECNNNSFGNDCERNSFSNNCHGNSFGDSCTVNSFGNDCCMNSFGDGSGANKFGDECQVNSFGNNCGGNSFIYSCFNNSFGNDCQNNNFDHDCCSNSFGNDCQNNNFDHDCCSNSFGESCFENIFGDTCTYNSFGEDCYSNSFGENCVSNSFGNACDTNSLGNRCRDNSFGNRCIDNSLSNTCYRNSFGNGCNNNSFGYECENNSFGNSCIFNSFGNYFTNNSFSNDCENNSFGNSCACNSFGNGCIFNSFRLSASTTGDLLDYCCNNHFDDGCSYNVIWNNVQPTASNILQNINVVRRVSGKSSKYNFINIVDKNADYEIKVAKNSKGEIKIYCEADLIK